MEKATGTVLPLHSQRRRINDAEVSNNNENGVNGDSYSPPYKKDGNKNNDNNNNNHDKYSDFPLLQSMMKTEKQRTLALKNEGCKQIKYPKSNTGWIRTLFVWEGRALGRILFPWSIVTGWAILWAVIYETQFRDGYNGQSRSEDLRQRYIESMLELVISTTLGFLLVFRLNRSATRFWMARGSWGIIVVKIRAMVGSILLNGSHDPYHRDRAVKWLAAFSVVSMNFTRGATSGIDPHTVEGLLTMDELDAINAAAHPPLHAADRIRFHVGELFGPSFDEAEEHRNGNGTRNENKTNDDGAEVADPTSGNDAYGKAAFSAASHFRAASRAISRSNFRTQILISLEKQLIVLIDEEGALERIKGTPLPLVYVAHLRTWLMLFLLSQPYIWESALGYATIPVVALVAFALLGLEGAAAEVEAPFRKDRTNHLDMNSFCVTVLSNVVQQMKEDADRRLWTKEQQQQQQQQQQQKH